MSDYDSENGKREHHNAMERKRRDQLKDSFIYLHQTLVDCDPQRRTNADGSSSHMGRATILTKAADTIQLNDRKNAALRRDIADLESKLDMQSDQDSS